MNRNHSLRQTFFLMLIAALAGAGCANLLEVMRSSTLAAPVALTEPSVASDERNNVEIYRAASPGVVHITSTVNVRSFFGAYPQQGTGSGSIIDDKGRILTNYHVVRDAHRLDVTLADKSTYQAKLVGADPDNDIAVVQIEAPAEKLHVIQMGNSTELEVGQKVLAIGNPFGLDRTLTTGVISGLGRPLETEEGRLIENVIQTDASINPGNSGGPLLDKYGRIVGINTAIFSPSGGSVGIGFAVPVDTARRLLPELISNGKIRHGWLGVATAPITPRIAEAFHLSVRDGAVVTNVMPNSPASSAGLRGVTDDREIGDVLVGVGDKPVRNPAELAYELGNRSPGEKVVLDVLRNGRRVKVPVTLGERPA